MSKSGSRGRCAGPTVRRWAGRRPTNHGFLDKPVDATGLVAVGARYYDPGRARFISVDPVMDLSDPRQWNPYAYASNNPITFMDPTGMFWAEIGSWFRENSPIIGAVAVGILAGASCTALSMGVAAVGCFALAGGVAAMVGQSTQATIVEERAPTREELLTAGAVGAVTSAAGTGLLAGAGRAVPWARQVLLRSSAPPQAATTNAIRQNTTILGENMSQRVIPFANRTGARHLGFGASADEWAAMTPRQRWRLNDGMLRARINQGDSFRYIGRDPDRPARVRASFDLTGSELLRLNSRGITYDIVSPDEVYKHLGRY